MITPQANPASFRDPRGTVYYFQDRILRSVLPAAKADFEFVRATPLIQQLIKDGKLLAEKNIDKSILQEVAPQACYVLEHPRLPFISYPYEWSFAQLKAAALLHLEIQLQALEQQVTLLDASAYNIQFLGAQPVFIDHLAFVKYVPGSMWAGYRQFCQQFLNPLLLQAYTKTSCNAWYRGSLEGITTTEIRRVLPWYRKIFPKVLLHVVLPSALQKTASATTVVVSKINFPLASQKKLLRKLQAWIRSLTVTHNTVWQSYAKDHAHYAVKAAAVTEFIAQCKPVMVYDLGCNSGEFAAVGLQTGAQQVIGFETDPGALQQAYLRSLQNKLAFLPLAIDLANPSPAQGWNSQERYSLVQRGAADAVLALAVIHHLAIARNIPLAKIVSWLLELAPQGLVEFVPKQDAQLQKMLQLREDIFPDYNLENFMTMLTAKAKIKKIYPILGSERTLIWYQLNERINDVAG